VNWKESIFSGRELTRRERLAISLIIAFGAGIATMFAFMERPEMLARDFTYPLRGALALMEGQDPYEVIRPSGPPPYDWPFMYPLTAALVATPFALLPMQLAGVLFVMCGVTAFVYVMSKGGLGRCWVLLSVPFFMSVVLAQWGPLIIAGTMSPVLGWALAAKPTIGLALFAYRPTWKTAAAALLLTTIAFLVQPDWMAEWFGVARTLEGHPIPAANPIGALSLLALLRWRRPEARLVGVMALIPQNLYFYDQLPLWLAARNAREGLVLTFASWVAWAGMKVQCVDPHWCGPEAEPWILACVYLPAAAIVLFSKDAASGVPAPTPSMPTA
jgi:hypothetical protein